MEGQGAVYVFCAGGLYSAGVIYSFHAFNILPLWGCCTTARFQYGTKGYRTAWFNGLYPTVHGMDVEGILRQGDTTNALCMLLLCSMYACAMLEHGSCYALCGTEKGM
jgi:hypothetical protein